MLDWIGASFGLVCLQVGLVSMLGCYPHWFGVLVNWCRPWVNALVGFAPLLDFCPAGLASTLGQRPRWFGILAGLVSLLDWYLLDWRPCRLEYLLN